MKLEPLVWDSAFFGKEIARLSLKAAPEADAEQLLIGQPFDLVYVFSDTPVEAWRHKLISHSASIKLMDEKLVYKRKTSSFQSNTIDQGLEVVTLKTLSQDLLKLVFRSGIYSRFQRDPHLKHRFEKMYEAWIVKSLRETNQEVIALRKDAELLGFVSMLYNTASSSIQLIATSEGNEGKGYGSLLIDAALKHSEKKDASEITVATQAMNTSARRFYEKLGFDIIERKYIYHFWNLKKQ